MASVQLEFFRAQKVSRAVDLQISTPRCASHGCNSLERALANQLAACKKMQKDAKRYEDQRGSKRTQLTLYDTFALVRMLLPYLSISYIILPCIVLFNSFS